MAWANARVEEWLHPFHFHLIKLLKSISLQITSWKCKSNLTHFSAYGKIFNYIWHEVRPDNLPNQCLLPDWGLAWEWEPLATTLFYVPQLSLLTRGIFVCRQEKARIFVCPVWMLWAAGSVKRRKAIALNKTTWVDQRTLASRYKLRFRVSKVVE